MTSFILTHQINNGFFFKNIGNFINLTMTSVFYKIGNLDIIA